MLFVSQIRGLQILSLVMNTTQKAGGELPALVPECSPIPSLQLLATRNTRFFYSKHRVFVLRRKYLNAIMPPCPARCTGCPGVCFGLSPNLFVYVGKLLSDRESAGKLWGFDLNVMKIKAAACSPLPAPIGVAVKTAAVSLLLWFSKPRLVIYPVPSIQHQCCPRRALWWSVCCFGECHLAKSLDLAGALQEPHGNESPLCQPLSAALADEL